MKTYSPLQKIVFATSLAAVSVAIDVFFKFVLNIQFFGLPFYAIPVILGGIILGPGYGAAIGFVADAIGLFMSGGTYMPLYALGPVIWGFLPGLILYKRYSVFKLAWVVPLTYLFVNLNNTLASFVYFGSETTLSLLVLRMALIPFNSLIIFFVVKDVHVKLAPFFERFTWVKGEAKA